tara:strand:- start:8129 stop:8944 length:816 start_codon:yes stop_codon:yes gene_type:complete
MKLLTSILALSGALVISTVLAQEPNNERPNQRERPNAGERPNLRDRPNANASERGPAREGERGNRMNSPEIHHHYYHPAGGYGYGTNYGYGSGYQSRGFSGGLASGIGEAREDTAQAANTYAETAHMVQENHNYAVNSYYANREARDRYVAAHREAPPTEQELEAFGKSAEPGRLSNAQFDRSTNVIHWPGLLRDSDFTSDRQALDHLFHDRTPDDSGSMSASYGQIQKACDSMMKTLGKKDMKEHMPTVTFIGCEHFIKSLAYEGSFAVK